MQPHLRTRRRQAGFTTLESLVAMSVLFIGMATYSSLASETIYGGSVSRRVSAASNLASDKLEALRAESYASLVSGSETAPLTAEGSAGGDDAIFARSWTVTAGPTTNTKSVAVEVAWGPSGDDRGGVVRLETIVLDW